MSDGKGPGLIAAQTLPRVLYSYRCAACRHQGEVHLADDAHDGELSTCSICGASVVLEWDGGATFSIERPPGH